MNQETLGPADKLVNALLTFTDHMVHNRAGVVKPDASSVTGTVWVSATWRKQEDGTKKVFEKRGGKGSKTVEIPMGTLGEDMSVTDDAGRKVGEYRDPGIYPEVALWLYAKAAEIWELDHEFAARWASYAYVQRSKDLKVVLTALMLVQSRKGDPVRDGDETFYDLDFRDVGEAMILLYDKKAGNHLDPKLMLRVRDVLTLPGIVAINRKLGFGKSDRNPFYGRWPRVVEKYLRFREENPALLRGLVKAGMSGMVRDLCRKSGYKPSGPDFFKTLGWKQAQAKDGHRTLAIGQEVEKTATWEGMTEEEVCKRILSEKPNYKVLAGVLPKGALTRAAMAAAVEAGCMSPKDLIILTPSLEDMGLLKDPDVKAKWDAAMKVQKDMRAANIARRVKSKDVADALNEGADEALKEAIAEVLPDVRIYFMVDRSSSMHGAIEAAKEHVSKFLQGFPPDRVHVSVFNSTGQEIQIRKASAAGVANAFQGVHASGGTDYGAGIRAIQKHKPLPGEDVLFIFVGDEQAPNFNGEVLRSGLKPMAFGFVKVVSGRDYGSAVRDTARSLNIPCFMIDERTFEDPYAIPQTVRALVAATPVGYDRPAHVEIRRKSLAETIMDTELLEKPFWAA